MKRYLAAMLGATLALFGVHASAALSTEVGTALTGLQTDALALVDLVWPVVAAVTVAFVIFKLFKRGIGKI